MKKLRSTHGQVIAVLNEAVAGIPMPERCRTHSIRPATIYK